MWQVKTSHRGTRSCPRGHGLAVFVIAALLPAIPPPANAEPKPLAAEVVWARGDRAHVASTDSIPVEVGDLLDFQSRGKTVAAGTVAVIHEAGLVTARITSGTLGRVKKLRDVRIRTEPAPLPRLSKMRIAVPSDSRPNRMFITTSAWRYGPRGYRQSGESGGATHFVRVDSIRLEKEWPETLAFIPFDDSTDEEIAIGRGEVDLAIFWPGELSPQARRQDGFRSFHGTLARGVLAGIQVDAPRADGGAATATSEQDSTILLLNQKVFGGDLLPIDPFVPRGFRFQLGSFFPDWRMLERWIALREDDKPTGRMRLVYLDTPAESDSIRAAAYGLARNSLNEPALRKRLEAGEKLVYFPLYRVRCALVCEPDIRRLVQALGPDRFAAFLGDPEPGGPR